MKRLALLLVIPAALASGQTYSPDTLDALEQAANFTASPELVKTLLNEVPGITSTQAQGAAGALFGVAKARLSADDFAKVAGAVRNMDGLLQAAVPYGTGTVPDAAAAAGLMWRLGLKPDQVALLTPALVKFVEAKGGSGVGALLAGALN